MALELVKYESSGLVKVAVNTGTTWALISGKTPALSETQADSSGKHEPFGIDSISYRENLRSSDRLDMNTSCW